MEVQDTVNGNCSCLDVTLSPNVTVSEQNYTMTDNGYSLATDAAQQLMYIFVMPTIIFVGLIGNSLSFIVFTRTPLKAHSSSVYLAALAISDSGFLICLLFSWFNFLDINFFHHQVWCQMFVYLTFVFSFLSVWYIVAFTTERFIAVVYPLYRQKVCTTVRARKCVIGITIAAVVMYNSAIWTNTVIYEYGEPKCIPNYSAFYSLITVCNYMDTAITFFIPFIMIAVMNGKIMYKLMHLSGFHVDDSSNSNHSAVELQTPVLRGRTMHQALSVRMQNQTKITRMLITVSTSFLLMNLPSHVVRIYSIVLNLTGNWDAITPQLQLWQEIFQQVYYLNFSVNIFLYSLSGKNFRQSMMRKFLCTKCRRCMHATNGNMHVGVKSSMSFQSTHSKPSDTE